MGKGTMSRREEYVLKNHLEVLNYLKSRFPMYHSSNFFFRDVHYGIQSMFNQRGEKVSYADAEVIAKKFAERLEKDKIFIPVDRQSWAVNYPDFKTPPSGKAVTAAKPAAPAAKPAVPGGTA
jgi:hypothetical protein